VSEVIRVFAVIAIIGYVIGRQLMGEPLRGKRVVLLPVILKDGRPGRDRSAAPWRRRRSGLARRLSPCCAR
jgi:hypothetical protein